MKNELEKMGFSITKKKRQVNFLGGIASVQKLLDNKSVLGSLQEKYLTKEDRNIFAGGTPKELDSALKGGQDMRPFFTMKDKLMGTIGAKLQAELMKLSPQRKRKFSSFGGNFSYDRKFEPEPFVKFSTVKSGIERTMEIDVDFTISAGMGGQEINEYGCLVWAIADAIEQAGIQTKISLEVNVSSVDCGGTLDSKVKICLKEFGQYISPSFLATAMTSNFYRRLMFTLMAASARAFDRMESSGLGHCIPAPYFSSKGKGHIQFGPNMSPGHMKEVEGKILEAIAG